MQTDEQPGLPSPCRLGGPEDVVAGEIGDLETEVGCVTGDIPLLQPGFEPLIQLVGDLGLQSAIDGTLEVLKELTRVEILSRPRITAFSQRVS